MSSNSESSIPTELYSLVFSFLKDAGLSQTAKIFKKEINRSINVVNQKYGLVEVFKSYNSLVTGKNRKSDDLSSSSSSENSSNNEENESSDESSSSEDDGQSSEDEVSMKESNNKNEPDKVSESSDEEIRNDDEEMEDSSSSSSEDDDDSSIGEETSTIVNKEPNSSDSSSSDSSSEQSENDEQNVKVSSVSEDSDSSSESSSESNRLSEDVEENDKIEICSDSSSSNEESDNEQEKTSNVVAQDNKKTNSNSNGSDSESEESESDVESENESESRNAQNNIDNIIKNSSESQLSDKKYNGENKNINGKIDKSQSSNKNSSPNKINGVPLINGNKLKHKLDPNNDTLNDKDCTRPAKKLNSSVSTPHITTSVHFKPLSVHKNQKKNKPNEQVENKSNGNRNIYNRRINPEKVEFLDERLKDNSFLAKDGAIDSYGYKAHNDLSITRGKDFRAQKTKKKRGSYRGGKIDLGSHSVKFAMDD